MTAQFKTLVDIPPPPPGGVTFDDIYKPMFTLEAPQKQMVSPLYVTRIYTTTSEKKPIKWVSFDLSTTTNGDYGYLSEALKEWIKCCSSQSEYTGYMIVTMAVDHLNGVSKVMPEYCKEHWQVKEKVYINGPKKKPFPAKAAKHY